MTAVLLMAGALAVYALFSQWVSRLPLTAPMIFTALGLVSAQLGLIDIPSGGEAASILIEATLVMVLFSDAVSVNVRSLRRNAWLPLRLLLIGLPLTLGLGWLLATLILPGLSFVEAALLAAVLTPTDAALGQGVATDRRLPERLREGVSVESGLNDGIMVPVVLLLLSFAVIEEEGTSAGDAVSFAAQQIGVGVTVGVAIGTIAGFLIHRRSLQEQISGVYRQLGTLAVPVTAYAAASLLGGNGFIAAFLAGIGFGAMSCAQCRDVADLTTDDGVLLTTVAFFVFGAAFLAPRLDEVTAAQVVYVALSLTVVRLVPVLLSLVGTPMQFEPRLFIGWFGPRGLATILFVLLVAREVDTAGAETVVVTGTLAVGVSIYAHGATALPWTRRLERRFADQAAAATAAASAASHRIHSRADRVADAPHL